MVRTALLTLWVLALTAPAALAYPDKDGGNGWYVPADDKVVTNVGFILIAGFPLFILICSLIQWRLEKRKDARKAAAKARLARADARGGRWSCSASRTSLAKASSPPSIPLSPESIRSRVVLPEPLRPDSVSRSRRSSLNETPRSRGEPAMSLARSDAMATDTSSRWYF